MLGGWYKNGNVIKDGGPEVEILILREISYGKKHFVSK